MEHMKSYIKENIPEHHFSLIQDNEVEYLFKFLKQEKQLIDYDIRYMRLAREYSTWSKDPSTKVGSIAISSENNILISAGYNGFPRGIADDYRLYIRQLKYAHVVHAEMNMIYNACENGVSLKKSTVYVYGLFVCSNCIDALIQVGVSRIVMCNTKDDPRWTDSFELTMKKLQEINLPYSIINKKLLDI